MFPVAGDENMGILGQEDIILKTTPGLLTYHAPDTLAFALPSIQRSSLFLLQILSTQYPFSLEFSFFNFVLG